MLDPVTIIKFGQIFQNLTIDKSMVYVAFQRKIQQEFRNIQGLQIQTQMQKMTLFLRICKNTNKDHLVVPYDPPFPPSDIKGKIFQNSLVMIPVQSTLNLKLLPRKNKEKGQKYP